MLDLGKSSDEIRRH